MEINLVTSNLGKVKGYNVIFTKSLFDTRGIS
jgi:hypothetical protein